MSKIRTAVSSSAKSASAEKTVILAKIKDCKSCVRYGTEDPDSPVRDVYVMREFAKTMPESIEITIRAK